MSGAGQHAQDHDAEPLSFGPIVQVSLLVRDLDAAVAFYRDVLGLPHLFSGAPHHVHTDASGVQEWMMFFEDPDGNTLGALARIVP